MAKGDAGRAQQAVNTSVNQGNAQLLGLQGRQQGIANRFQNTYDQYVPQNLQNYSDIMDSYRRFMNPSIPQQPPNPNAPGSDRATGIPPSTPNAAAPSNTAPNTGGAPPRPDDLMEALQVANQTAYGGTKNPTEADAAYWRDMWAKDPDYTFKRMLGWQAGGKDMATAGPYAGGAGGISGSKTGDPFYDAISNTLGGYQNFAETGGFSPEDLQNIRARAVAPIRSVYSRANEEVDRQRRLQNGFSPNYTAAKAKMAREQAYSTADASTNAEAAIAQMIQSGKLAGLGGMSQTGLGARGQNLSALGGQTNLYGASPGMATTFGNQVLQSGNQDINVNQLMQGLNELRIRGQLGVSGIPSGFQQGLGNVSSLLGLGGQAVRFLAGLGSPGRGNSGNDPSMYGLDTTPQLWGQPDIWGSPDENPGHE